MQAKVHKIAEHQYAGLGAFIRALTRALLERGMRTILLRGSLVGWARHCTMLSHENDYDIGLLASELEFAKFKDAIHHLYYHAVHRVHFADRRRADGSRRRPSIFRQKKPGQPPRRTVKLAVNLLNTTHHGMIFVDVFVLYRTPTMYWHVNDRSQTCDKRTCFWWNTLFGLRAVRFMGAPVQVFTPTLAAIEESFGPTWTTLLRRKAGHAQHHNRILENANLLYPHRPSCWNYTAARSVWATGAASPIPASVACTIALNRPRHKMTKAEAAQEARGQASQPGYPAAQAKERISMREALLTREDAVQWLDQTISAAAGGATMEANNNTDTAAARKKVDEWWPPQNQTHSFWSTASSSERSVWGMELQHWPERAAGGPCAHYRGRKIDLDLSRTCRTLVCRPRASQVNTPCCERKKLKTLLLTHDALTSVGLPYWIESGALIGAIRTGGLVLNDYDVDIGVAIHGKADEKKYKRAAKYLAAHQGAQEWFQSAAAGRAVNVIATNPNPSNVSYLDKAEFQQGLQTAEARAQFKALIERKNHLHLTSVDWWRLYKDADRGKDTDAGADSGTWAYVDPRWGRWPDLNRTIFPLGRCNVHGYLFPCPKKPREHLTFLTKPKIEHPERPLSAYGRAEATARDIDLSTACLQRNGHPSIFDKQ